MRVWRLSRAEFAHDPLSGVGAAMAGGRWNSRGHEAIYTADTLASAVLEVLVHLEGGLPTPAYPFPQIYATCTPTLACIGANAVQWERIARYHRLKTGGLMAIQGALTQYVACPEFPSMCPTGSNNTANEGYNQL